MEYKANSEKPTKLDKGLEKKSCGEIITAETVRMEYPDLSKVRNYDKWGNFSNWNNWPHSR